jgi:hypothetical protein
LWSGSNCDKQITKSSGLIEPGDVIMGDKGFFISDLCTPKGIYLIVPPTKKMANYQNMKWNKPDNETFFFQFKVNNKLTN